MNILVRADSSSLIGTGHIMRDLVLVNKFKEDNIYFAVQDLKGNINYKIDKAGYKKLVLGSNKLEELDEVIKSFNIDMVILDHYGIDFNFEKSLKEMNPKLKIYCLDDTYEKHHCDILLNHNINANKNKYRVLVPDECKLFCGSKYTLLRDEFSKVKKRIKTIKKREPLKSVFVGIGGADHSNINIKILEVLEKLSNIRVNIVTTYANKNLKKLEKFCKKRRNVKLYINSSNVARLMAKCDFAIVSASVTVNEVKYLNLPVVAIKTAENQKELFNYLKTNRCITLNKFNKAKLEFNLRKFSKKR